MNRSGSGWWGAPRTIVNSIENRKISWLELFSDLVYVVIIHGFVENLTEHFNLAGFICFWVLFLFFFNTWTNMVLYFDLHGQNNLRNTFFALLQVVAIAITATFTTDVFEGNYTGFILAYSFNQAIYMYLYLRTMISDPLHARTTRPFLIAYLVGEGFFIGSIFITQEAVQQGLIIVSLLIFISAVMAENRNFDTEFRLRKIPFNLNSAILERYGLFTMIVLGESVAGSIEHMTESAGNLAAYGHFILALLCVIGTWMVYYTLMDERQVVAQRYWPISLFRGIHRFMIACLTLQSFFISEILTRDTPTNYRGLFIVTALALSALFCLTCLSLYNVVPLRSFARRRLLLGILVVLVMVLVPTLVGLLVVDGVLLIIGVWSWLETNRAVGNA